MVRFNSNVSVSFDSAQLERKVNKAVKKAQMALDQQIIKDSNFYIPLDTGELMRSAITSSRIGFGIITWNTPYARRLYYNPQYNFSKDANPNAQGLWFEAAKSTRVKEWEKIAKQAFKRGFS